MSNKRKPKKETDRERERVRKNRERKKGGRVERLEKMRSNRNKVLSCLLHTRQTGQ